MTPSRYIVIQCGGAWAISGPLARFPTMFTRSTPRSISPEKMAKPAAPPKCKRTEDRCDPFGLMDATRTLARRPLLQMAGPPGHIACHDHPVSDAATCQSAGVASIGP
jgi:hypothetical protein